MIGICQTFSVQLNCDIRLNPASNCIQVSSRRKELRFFYNYTARWGCRLKKVIVAVVEGTVIRDPDGIIPRKNPAISVSLYGFTSNVARRQMLNRNCAVANAF